MTGHRQEIATLGGGCFWCLDAVLRDLRGAQQVVSGYTGGQVADPSYELVCKGTTGHVEVVQVTFDPDAISFGELLEVFFTIHDPTTLNRQGGDVGPQYRSAIFYHSPEQRATVEEVLAQVQRIWGDPIVTDVSAFDTFYPAEDRHQDYYRNNRSQPYCQIVIATKVAGARKEFLAKLKR